MGLWRSFTHGKAGRDEEERRKKELQDLKDALAAAEAEVQKYREQKSADNKRIRELEDSLEELRNSNIETQRRLQMEVDMAKRNEAMAKENAAFEKEHSALQMSRLQKSVDEAVQDANDKETIHQRSLTKNTQLVAELQVELN